MSSLDVPILFIIGSGDESDRIAHAGGTKILVTGASDLHRLLLDSDPYELLHISRNFFRQTRETRLQHYRMLVNLITEPEQSSRTLENLRKLLRGVPGKIINRPEAVLRSTRDSVARILNQIPGLIVPKAARLSGNRPTVAAQKLGDAGVPLPVILRQAGTHGGAIFGRFSSVEETVAALKPGCDHLATQFVDFSSADGLYRKYRVFLIGKHRILRHMLVSESWNVHADTRSEYMALRPQLISEERSLMESDDPFPQRVEEVLQAVQERLPLDFFGMDFGLTKEGDVVLFEANATMSFFPFSSDPQFAYLLGCFEPARNAFRELLGLGSVGQSTRGTRLQIQSS